MAQHDFQRLQPGDRVVEINGSSNVEDMRIIMSTELILHIKVERLQETPTNGTEKKPPKGTPPHDGEGPPPEFFFATEGTTATR